MIGRPVVYRWLVVAVVVLAAMSYGYKLITEAHSENKLSELPVYGIPNADSSDHTIKDFKLIDQFGKTVTQADFKGKIYVADFIFTTCQGICPIMSNQLERVYHQYKGDYNVLFLSHTVKPYEDSVPVLKAYAELHDVQTSQWRFVTGDKKQIYDLARTAYMVGDTVGAGGEDDFVHTQFLALIDPQSRIRGFYDGTDSAEVNKLILDLETLRKEEFKTDEKPDMNASDN